MARSSRPASDPWSSAAPYERFMGRWSRPVAEQFVEHVPAASGGRWLDVGCGTGSLTAAVAAGLDPSVLVGLDPSFAYVQAARRRIGSPARFVLGSVVSLPFADGSFDGVLSGLVLNFLPDPVESVRETMRVTGSGGIVGAYVWDYADGMGFLRAFWDAAVSLDPSAAELDEGRRLPICHPDRLREVWPQAGLRDVSVEAIEVATRFADFEDLWEPFLGGQGPAPSYVASLDDGDRERLRDALRSRLPVDRDGAIELSAPAWAVTASRGS